ncbi:MAG: PIG-L family deacetylase [Lachnospiraceae bacterium]|nr:PIG-L family deacetylase [Lachnospiraceae bacterium]
MSITKLALRIAAPFPKLDSFNRYLFVGPHPDDIEIGAGASAAALAAQGKKVCFLICTDGRYGTDNLTRDITEEELITVRKNESLRSAAALGVKDVRFLGLSDGGFYENKELIKGIASVISSFQPDIIFAPDPSPSSECHIDHLNVGRAVRTLALNASNPGIMKKLGAEACQVKAAAFYMTAKPNSFMKTTGFLKKQLDALFDNHISQYPEGCADRDSIGLYLKLRAADFGIRSFHRSAEGFRVLGKLHMHCLPEAGC